MCKCTQIVREINEKFPSADWNLDEACKEWHERKDEIEDNSIEFERHSDACYSCTCPSCGTIICSWCL